MARPAHAPDFDQLFRTGRRRLLAVARRIMRNDDDAEDVLQHAFLLALRAGDQFEGQAQVSSWMFRIVANTALMALRTRRRHPTARLEDTGAELDAIAFSAEPDDPEALLIRSRLRERISTAVGELSPVDRKIVELRLGQQHSTEQVAREVELSPAAMKARLHRARRQLVHALAA